MFRTKHMQLHAFADASERVCGAVVYVRANYSEAWRPVRLFCAKSRVAPLKTVTLPQLELCATKLATELVHRLKCDLKRHASTGPIHKSSWTDYMQRHHRFPPSWRLGVHPYNTNPHEISENTLTPSRIRQTWCLEASHRKSFAIKVIGSSGQYFFMELKTSGRGNIVALTLTWRKNKQNFVLSVETDQPSFVHKIHHRDSFRWLERIMSYGLCFIKNTRAFDISDRAICYLDELEGAFGVIIRTAQWDAHPESTKLPWDSN